MPNLHHRWGDGYAREAGANKESLFPNHRYRWGYDGVLATLYQRIALRMYYGIAVLSGVIDLVVLGNRDAFEALANSESPFPNLSYRWGYDGVLASTYQRIALRMYYGIAVLSGVIDLVVLGNCDAREAGAMRESHLPNLLHRWRYGDAREAGATPESLFPNLRYRWGDGDAREAGATLESIAPNHPHRWRDGDAREAGATIESIPPNLCHRWGDGDARKSRTTRESTFSYLLHPFRQSDFREVPATPESLLFDLLYPLR